MPQGLKDGIGLPPVAEAVIIMAGNHLAHGLSHTYAEGKEPLALTSSVVNGRVKTGQISGITNEISILTGINLPLTMSTIILSFSRNMARWRCQSVGYKRSYAMSFSIN